MNRQKIKVSHDQVRLVPHRGKTGDLTPLVRLFDNSDGEMLVPAVARDHATGGYVMLLGERRWRAAVRASAPLYVIVCDVWADFLAWLILDKYKEHPANVSRPMALTDMVTLTETVKQYLNPGRDDRLDDTLGEYFGVPASRIGETRSIKRVRDRNLPDDVRAIVEHEWLQVERGEASPSAAFQRIRKYEIRKDAPAVDVTAQRQKLRGVVTVCTGLTDALANFGDVSPELSADERSGYIASLADARRMLENVIGKLRKAGEA